MSKPSKNNKQTHSFQTEVSQLLDLMIHSLYSNKEIFLRELISNCSDAIDKLRFESLSDNKLAKNISNGQIHIDVNKEAKTITIKDNGIGMTQTEVMENIGTIANSGTKKFLASLDKNHADDAQLIGQFGVGFYASFIVAKEVVIETLKAGDNPDNGTRWRSKGKGDYSIQTIKKTEYGTTVVLHIKVEQKEFLDDYRLKNIIHTYSEHIAVPIMMLKPAEVSSDDKEDKDKAVNDAIEYETINKAKAFWTEDKKSLKQKDYDDFYQQLSYDMQPPLAQIHNHVEGKMEYTSLFYIPSKAPFDLWEPKQKGGIKLYSKRIFIMDDNDKLMPTYLRFIKGIIDTSDLPLNVSREILQGNKIIDKIRGASVKRILSTLAKMAKNKPEDYVKFWSEFGMVIKEGVVEDFANKNAIAELLRFSTTHDALAQQTVSLADYVARMADEQKAIYYMTSDSFMAAKNSPHLEIFKRKNIEVLLLSDKVDEWLVNNFTEFKSKPLKSIAKGDLSDLESKEDKEAQAKTDQNFESVIKEAEELLKDKVKNVKISHRLQESASCLTADETDMGSNMERIMKSLGQAVPETKPILELNPNHPLVERLKNKMDKNLLEVLFDQAVLSEGGQIKEPAAFVKRMNDLLLG